MDTKPAEMTTTSIGGMSIIILRALRAVRYTASSIIVMSLFSSTSQVPHLLL